jgi:hypothetical protein
LIADPRNPLLVTHSDVFYAPATLAIACGYEDADDLDHLRTDPGFKLACGVCLIPVTIYALSRPCRVGRMRRACVRWCA